MKKFILPYLFVFTTLIGGFLLVSKVAAQSNADCLKQYHTSQGSCSVAAKACIDACPGAQGVDLGPLSECLRSCDKQTDSCNDAAEAAYDACIATSRQGQQTPAEAEKQEPEKKTDQKTEEQKTIFDILGINPYQAWLKFNNWAKTFSETGKIFNRLLVALVDHEFCAPEDCDKAQKLLERKPVLSEQEVKLEPLPSDNSHWPFIMPYVIQTGKDESVFYNLPDLEKGGGVKVLPDTQLELPQLELDWGEAEFFIIGSNTKTFKVTTPNAELVVSGTHFWVSHDQDQKQTAVGVYEGKVEVKTKDGKTTTVTPQGDKPGVVVVAQKLSVIKLAAFGVILAAVIGSAILIVRRKIFSKTANKKKR